MQRTHRERTKKQLKDTQQDLVNKAGEDHGGIHR
jgi:hypothetical protein